MAILDAADPASVEHAAQALRDGQLVAFPTETVYGLGARADDAQAVARVFAAKGRPTHHPLIVHVADQTAARFFAASIGPNATALAEAFWPGPLTLILPRRPGCTDAAAGGQSSIGLRAPDHPLAQALIGAARALGVPGVAAPSANRFGRVSATTAAHVAQEFGEPLLILDAGPSAVGIESTIVDCTRDERPALLRPGAIGRDRIEACLGRPLATPDAATPRASGTLASHYAPAARVRLMDATELQQAAAAASPERARTVALYSRQPLGAGTWLVERRMPADAAAAAHELFATLRAFDDAGVAQIWIERPPAAPEWEGVNDRLRRAAVPPDRTPENS